MYPALCDPMDRIAHQAPLSTGFSRQVYWSGLPCPPSGDLPNPGFVTASLTSLKSPALAGRFFTPGATGDTLRDAVNALSTAPLGEKAPGMKGPRGWRRDFLPRLVSGPHASLTPGTALLHPLKAFLLCPAPGQSSPGSLPILPPFSCSPAHFPKASHPLTCCPPAQNCSRSPGKRCLAFCAWLSSPSSAPAGVTPTPADHRTGSSLCVHHLHTRSNLGLRPEAFQMLRRPRLRKSALSVTDCQGEAAPPARSGPLLRTGHPDPLPGTPGGAGPPRSLCTQGLPGWFASRSLRCVPPWGLCCSRGGDSHHPQPLHATPEPLLSALSAIRGASCVLSRSCEGSLLVSNSVHVFLMK